MFGTRKDIQRWGWFASIIYAVLATPVVAQVLSTVANPAPADLGSASADVALWQIAERYGIPGICLVALYFIHRDQSVRYAKQIDRLIGMLDAAYKRGIKP